MPKKVSFILGFAASVHFPPPDLFSNEKFCEWNNINLDETYYIYENTENINFCVSKCPSDKPFAYEQYTKKCKEKCPDDKRYFIKDFVHGETDVQKKCLSDCPLDYPFYTIRADIDNPFNKYYECQSSCDG